MAVLQTALLVLLAITSVLLILLILLHKGRGGGVADMFGGGMSSTMSSSGVAERNLNRITIVLGLIWVVVIIVLGLFTRFPVGLNNITSFPLNGVIRVNSSGGVDTFDGKTFSSSGLNRGWLIHYRHLLIPLTSC